MEEKEKTFLEVSPRDKDFRLLIADDLLTKMPPEERLKVFKEIFMAAAKNYNDEAAEELMCLIGREYQRKERKISDETYHHYGNADKRADADFCEYLRSIYWELPDKKKVGERRQYSSPSPYEYIPEYGPTLFKTKAKIIELWVRQWARYDYNYDYNRGQRCFKEVNEESLGAFRFLTAAYAPRGKDWLKQPYESEDEIKARGRMVFKEEKGEILKLFREAIDDSFTPGIAEKWLALPNVPEEIRKIFRIAWIRNGGQELFDRCMKNAEMLKPLEVEKRSEAAMRFHQKFSAELAEVDLKIQSLIEKFKKISLGEADKILLSYYKLDEVLLQVCFAGNKLPYHSLTWAARIQQLGSDIHHFLSECRTGRCVKILFNFWEDDSNRGNYQDTAYLG